MVAESFLQCCIFIAKRLPCVVVMQPFCNENATLQKGCIAITQGNLFAMLHFHCKKVALQPPRKTFLQCCFFIAKRLHGNVVIYLPKLPRINVAKYLHCNVAIYLPKRPRIKLAKHLPGNIAICPLENLA